MNTKQILRRKAKQAITAYERVYAILKGQDEAIQSRFIEIQDIVTNTDGDISYIIYNYMGVSNRYKLSLYVNDIKFEIIEK